MLIESGPFSGLEKNGYGALLADPPWAFRAWSARGEGRSAKQHYAVSPLDEIAGLAVPDVAAKDCALFLWSINSMLPEALQLIKAWGFIYKTVGFTWAKKTKDSVGWHMGMGYWTRQNTESCLLATRGKPRRIGRDVRQLIIAPRQEHSRKPCFVHEHIERLAAGPWLELFARESKPRPGWTYWGNETEKFNVPEVAE